MSIFQSCRADTSYKVNVFGMFEGGESMPLIGEEKTTLADVPDVSVLHSGKCSFNEENSAWCSINEARAFIETL